MGFWDDLTGKSAQEAANAAAADQYAKQQAATAALRASGGQYARDVGGLAGAYEPYTAAGGAALQRLMAGLGLGGDQQAFTNAYRGLPGYQSGLETGTNAAIRAANAGGSLASGGTLKALQRFGSDYEDQRIGDYLSRLMGINQMGYDATGRGVGLQAEGFRGRLGAETAAGQGDLSSSGTIGQGMVAGAQARQDALGNLLSTGASLAGNVLGGPLGGSLMGGLGSAAKFAGGTSLMSNRPRVGPLG